MSIQAPERLSFIGRDIERVDARLKVTGRATYAYEYPAEHVAYAYGIGAAVARGRITGIDSSAAQGVEGVIAVLDHTGAPRLGETNNRELLVFQSDRVSYRGQLIAAVIAESFETARDASQLVSVSYEQDEHDVVLTEDHPASFRPEHVAYRVPEVSVGDVETALAQAEITVDQAYATAAAHHMALEPHASLAIWEEDQLTVFESSQYAYEARDVIAKLFALGPEQVRVINGYVGGGFGSKGSPRPQMVIAAMASRVVGRPVKMALTRQQMFPVSGYRGPTVQRVRLGANRDGELTAFEHRAAAQTSRLHDFAEPCTTGTRTMYAAANRFDTHRLTRLDVPTPSFCRGPGEAPGFFAVESALDELAIASGVDPVELRIRNDTTRDPSTGHEYSTRNLVACLEEGARIYGWSRRRNQEAEGWRTGHGVASSMYPTYQMPSRAAIVAYPDGTFAVRLAAVDIGTGSRTALLQIAAEQLQVPLARVNVEIGDTSLPYAVGAFASLGTASWGHAVHLAGREMRQLLEGTDTIPPEGLRVEVDTAEEIQARPAKANAAFGAQFAQVSVRRHTGEVRVDRLVGVFAAGRIVNPRTTRSQLIGGMTWGISMALLEETALDPNLGEYVTSDLASFHFASCADIPRIEASWIEEDDADINPVGVKGVGEIGIVGTAAAIANAVFDATGVRVRSLPVRLDDLLGD